MTKGIERATQASNMGTADIYKLDNMPIDFLTHNVVRIAATDRYVWPYVLDPNSWKAGAKMFSIDGERGSIGERFRASMVETSETLYMMETVELITHKRWTVRLDDLDGALIGYATWELTQENGGTLLQYHTFCQLRLMQGSAVTQRLSGISSKDIVQDGSRRVDEEFQRLKGAVETAYTPNG